MVPGGSPAPLLVTDPGASRVPDTQQTVNGRRGMNGPTSDTSIQRKWLTSKNEKLCWLFKSNSRTFIQSERLLVNAVCAPPPPGFRSCDPPPGLFAKPGDGSEPQSRAGTSPTSPPRPLCHTLLPSPCFLCPLPAGPGW